MVKLLLGMKGRKGGRASMRLKRPSVRITCILLICMMIVSLIPVSTMKASDSYTSWKQNDSRWGSLTVGENGTMAKWGCKITVIAMLMVKASVENISDFNPGVLLERYEKAGYITHSSNIRSDGNLYSVATSKANSPKFYLAGTKVVTGTSDDYIQSIISELLDEGYYIEARVKNNGHSVAVNYCKNNEVYIMDPGYNRTELSQWSGTITKLNYYEAVPDKKVLETGETKSGVLEKISKSKFTATNVNYPASLAEGNVFSIYGTVSSADSVIKSLTVGVYTTAGKMKTGKMVTPKVKSYSIKKIDAYVKFGILPEGTYYYKIKATNSDGTSTLVNKKFTVK